MKRFVSLSVTTLLCAVIIKVLMSQASGKTYIKKYEEADRLYNLEEPTEKTDSNSLSLFLEVAAEAPGSNDALAVKSLIKAGNIHQTYQRFENANRCYHEAIAINNKYVKDDASLYEAYLYLGSSLYFANTIDSAQYYFEAASVISTKNEGRRKLPEQDRLYNSLGTIYFESANYLQAKNYFERAMQFSSPSADDYEDLYNGIQSNIANCLIKLNQFDSALKIFKSLSPGEQQKNIIRQNTAHCYFELGAYDSAMAIYQSLPLENGFHSVVALTDMGRIYMKRKEWQKAEVVFDSAIARNKYISVKIKNKEEALAYLYRSKLANEQGFTDEAITWINEALQEVHLDFTWSKPEDLPSDISKTVSPITLFSVLHAKANLLYGKYLKSKQGVSLSAAISAYKKALETANFIKLNFDNDEAKLFFNSIYSSIYREAIAAAYEAVSNNSQYANDYLFILENYKGNILYQSLQDARIKSLVGIPDSIKRRERELKQLLALYTTRINQSGQEKDAQQLQKRLLSIQVELSRVQKIYESDTSYSAYKDQLIQSNHSLEDIQNSLTYGTAIINYYCDSAAVYSFVITRKGFSLQRIKLDSVFQKTYRSFIGKVYHYIEGERYDGFEESQMLYRSLIAPVAASVEPFENWVIIPDGFLYYLPFEALVKNKLERHYVLLDHAVSYHYSLSLLFDKNVHYQNQHYKKDILSFAPYAAADEYIRNSGMTELPVSGKEVSSISLNTFLGKKATKQNFLSKAGQYPIIHLATHASIGEDSSSNWIQFYPANHQVVDNRLFLHDIYNIDLHRSELVVLSACETGGGTSAGGEGLLSLSRAFMYAGADGVVSTLWKTEDQITAYLMQKMHGYIRNNISPEKALRMAKIDLLNDKSIGSQYKTPNYWANFIYVGKLHSNVSSYTIWLYVFAGMILFSAGIWFIARKRRRASSVA